ncbi:MAG: hypothetical protein LUC96_00070 [Alistipes sp.]|uniref:tetratricopeptide repeat protein n=1 Tax=Alistipes sp. TaxID=1872444 RepID=UPI0025BF347A|nr:hypothetical protein [Alistipes sp.]MCD8273374.1 hypothetical protein [Alistipes sp.]
MYRHLYSLLLILFLFTSCRHEQIVQELSEADSCMQLAPNRALAILDSIDYHLISSEAERARYALLYTKALDKNFLYLESDSLIRCAVSYYTRHGKSEDLAWAYYYLAKILANTGTYDRALQSLIQAEETFDSTKDCYLKGMVYNLKAYLYAIQNDLDKATTFYRKAAKCYHNIDMPQNEMLVYDGLARSELLRNNNNAALEAIGTAQRIAEKLKDTTTILRCTQYHATILVDCFSDPEAALNILEKIYARYGLEASVSLYPMLSDLYFRLGHFQEARQYAEMYHRENLSLEQKLSILSHLRNIARAQHDNENYIRTNEEYLQIYDSLNSRQKQLELSEVETDFKQQRLADKNAHLYKQYSHVLLFGSAVIAFLLLALLVLFFLAGKQKLLRREMGL